MASYTTQAGAEIYLRGGQKLQEARCTLKVKVKAGTLVIALLTGKLTP